MRRRHCRVSSATADDTTAPPCRWCNYIPTDDDELLVSTMAARGKARAVARDGKVSLCVLDERWPQHRAHP
jgi:hypothetical protein